MDLPHSDCTLFCGAKVVKKSVTEIISAIYFFDGHTFFVIPENNGTAFLKL
jgi:hypothetical protein